jgi:hypothetical protein
VVTVHAYYPNVDQSLADTQEIPLNGHATTSD